MLFSWSFGQPLPSETFSQALLRGLDGVTSRANCLEVGKTMVISWTDMVYLGCSQGATFVSELTYTTIP